MRKRAAAIHGRLRILSKVGAGMDSQLAPNPTFRKTRWNKIKHLRPRPFGAAALNRTCVRRSDSKRQMRGQSHTQEQRSKFTGKDRKILIRLAPRDGLLGAARLAPSGPP